MFATGDPIDCIVEEIPNSVMDTYCWIHSTFRCTSPSSPHPIMSPLNIHSHQPAPPPSLVCPRPPEETRPSSGPLVSFPSPI